MADPVIGRRGVLAGGAALGLSGAVGAAGPGPVAPRGLLSGDRMDPAGDDSGRLLPPPPPGYWPYRGVSGPGRPVTAGSARGGWVSGLPDVRYRGPDAVPYPVAPWKDADGKDADGGAMVRDRLLPPLRPIHDVHLRDPVICVGHDGRYYMTGSGGDNIWATNDGIELWRSDDLARWDYLGLVWSFDRDGTWEKPWRTRKGVAFRAVWAPEIHFIGGNYYLTHSVSRAGVGLLRSATGRPEGPYVHAFSPTKPIRSGIDATLFADRDGSVWFVAGSADEILPLKPDLSGAAGPWVPMTAVAWDLDPRHHRRECAAKGYRHLGYEGATMFRRGDIYYLGVVDRYDDRYSWAMWMSDRPTGPWRDRHEVPGCGGGNVFRDRRGRWWTTFFGNDDASPFREKPGLARIDFAPDGRVRFAKDQPFATGGRA